MQGGERILGLLNKALTESKYKGKSTYKTSAIHFKSGAWAKS